MKSYKIHLIRHGFTDMNKSGKYIGITDIPLSKEGEDNLKYFKENFIYPNSELFYTSPLTRCVKTLNILYPKAKPIVLQGLSECNFGNWENKSSDELSKIPMFQDWLSGKKDISPPNGESSKDFSFRVCSTFETIVNTMIKSGKTDAVIVTHSGIITMLLAFYGLPRATFYDWLVEPGQGYSIRVIPSFWMRDKVVEVYQRIPMKKRI